MYVVVVVASLPSLVRGLYLFIKLYRLVDDITVPPSPRDLSDSLFIGVGSLPLSIMQRRLCIATQGGRELSPANAIIIASCTWQPSSGATAEHVTFCNAWAGRGGCLDT